MVSPTRDPNALRNPFESFVGAADSIMQLQRGRDQNALTSYLADNGQAILAGDRNALSGLAGMRGGLEPALNINRAQREDQQGAAAMLGRLILDTETPEQFEQVRGFAVRSGLIDPNQAQQYTFNDLPQLKRMVAEQGDWQRYRNVPGVGLVDLGSTGPDGRPMLVYEQPEGMQFLNLGNEYGVYGKRTGAPAAPSVPIDSRTPAAEAAAGKVEGTTQAERAANLPQQEASATYMIQLIDDLLAHPYLNRSVGPIQGRLPTLREGAADVDARIKQLTGRTFLEAYQMLKGGGAITAIEGEKGEQAIARLSTTQGDDAFRASLAELRDVVEIGLERARRGIRVDGGGGQSQDPGSQAAPEQPSGQTGQRIRVGNQILTGTPEGWADESGRIIYGPDGQPVR